MHERGTRRARASIAWATLLLMALSLTPRAWYARYIDVFGERVNRASVNDRGADSGVGEGASGGEIGGDV